MNKPTIPVDVDEAAAESDPIVSPPAPSISDAIVWHSAGSVLSVMVTPRSGVSTTTGVEAGFLRVRLAAPPVAGAANKALVRFLADLAKVAPSRVRIVAGASGRRKRVLFARVTMKELAARLGPVTSDPHTNHPRDDNRGRSERASRGGSLPIVAANGAADEGGEGGQTA